jgi:hypothetical protein
VLSHHAGTAERGPRASVERCYRGGVKRSWPRRRGYVPEPRRCIGEEGEPRRHGRENEGHAVDVGARKPRGRGGEQRPEFLSP